MSGSRAGDSPVLVIKLGALGDMVLAFPAFERIRAAHPKAKITLLTTPPFRVLAEDAPWFDAVETDGRPAGPLSFLRLAARVRRAGYARVYDLQGNDRTELLFQALRPSPPPWSGIAMGCALPARDPHRMARHTLERQAWQLRSAGIWPNAPVEPGTAPGPDVSWMLKADASPARSALVLLVPGASPRRPRKIWPAARYGELASALLADGYEVTIVGGPGEAAMAQQIRAAAPAASDLTGRTSLADLAALGARASLAVGSDTGPMHIIAAAGAPCVSLFSDDSDPALCAPRGRVRVVRVEDLASLEAGAVLDAARSEALRPQALRTLATGASGGVL